MAQIKTYARIKPTSNPSKHLDYETTNVSISIPEPPPCGQIRDRSSTLTHNFGFSGVFGPTASQNEVFDLVASHIVEGFLSGYNGTIFAYGQTGSGKTYTIEGGAKSYSDRGLAPRALSKVYKSLESKEFDELTVKVSYLEIYQEVGYDLLNPTTRPGNVVTHLPKVTVTDGPNNSCLVRNLSVHLAADERVAQSLLLQGQATRKVAETPMNQRSSRSHAVFTIYLKARAKGATTVTKSKLHLVDLAGSERVAKTKIAGQRLHEAKSINLSLHHLEGVIIALQGGKSRTGVVMGRAVGGARRRAQSAGPVRTKRVSSAASVRSLPYQRSMTVGDRGIPRHIPYRNSLLTMVLRDSLGGNCLTAMVATISAEDVNMSESLSTCRFAMRVAAIQNKISRNEIIDDKTVIAKLRKRIVTLEDEINRLKRRLAEDQSTQSSHSSHTKSIHPNYHQDSLSHPEPPHPSHTSSPRMRQPTSLADYPPAPLAPANGGGLNREGRHLCARLVQGYVSGKIKDPVAAGISDFSRFRECLKLLRDMIIRSYAYHQKYNPTLGFLQREGQPGSVERSDVKGQETERPPEVTVAKGKPKSNGSSKASKSPFEKKRDRDISRLGRSVQSRIAEQKQQKRDLMEFKTILKQQQLENAIRDLGGKIGMTTDHLEKQRALVQRLKECKASREQITAEKIAEKQLAKRLAKYEKRFQLAQEHLQIVKNHLELQERVLKSRQAANGRQGFDREGPDSQSESSNPLPGTMESLSLPLQPSLSSPRGVGGGKGHPTLNGQSHQLLDEQLLGEAPASQSGSLTDRIVESCRHKSGRVDSKRVLDILKTEEKKQNKAQKEIQKERIANFVQHFTLKEEATLSKLRHFKEQLKRQQQLQREEQRNGRGQSPSGVDHEANGGHHVTGMGEPCTDHVTGMGDPGIDHVQHAWAQGDAVQSRSRTSPSQMPHSHSNSQGGYPGAAGEKSGDSLTASPDDPSVFQPGSLDMAWSVERGKDVSSLSQVSQENRQCDDHHSTPDKDNAFWSSSELTLPNGNDFDNNSLTSSPAQGTPTHPQLIPGTSLPNHLFVKTNDISAASTLMAPQRSSSSISSNIGSRTAMHEHESTVPANTSQEKEVPVMNPVFHGSPAYETNRTSQPSSSITTTECSPPATMETHAAGYLGSVNSDMKAPSQSDLASISSVSGTSESAFQAQSVHSDSLASLRAAESLRHSSSSLGQGSFDAALASMLHQDRRSSRDSQAESLTSTLSSFSSPMQTVQQDQDVTTALKSKLLGYLADKPHSAATARSANSSTSSQSSLHGRWSRTSTYTHPMTRPRESILRQGENEHLSEVRGTPSVTSWDISSVHSDTSSPVPQNVSEIQSRGFKSNADMSFSSAVSPQTKASPHVDAMTFDVELGSELALSEHLVRDVSSKVRSIKETEGEKSYLSAARENKTRVKKIRKAVKSAEIIQKAWRKYKGNQPL